MQRTKFGLGMSLALGALASAASSAAELMKEAIRPSEDAIPPRLKYQRVRPVTSKNIGRNRLKGVSKYDPHQGERECARRRRQMAAGQLAGRMEFNG